MHDGPQSLALALDLHLQASRVICEALQLLFGRYDSARQGLVFFLSGVQQDPGHSLSLFRLIRPGEIRVLVSKNSNHITVGGGVVGLIHSLTQNDLDHKCHLAGAFQLNLAHLPCNGIQVLRRNLVQQRPHLTLKLLLTALRSRDLVGGRGSLRHLGRGSRAPSGLATGVSPDGQGCGAKHGLPKRCTSTASRPQAALVVAVGSLADPKSAELWRHRPHAQCFDTKHIINLVELRHVRIRVAAEVTARPSK
mmetsp:Transcript_17462/g.42013  ORF Transcript_17462/g.42013 Transcript_17462/m.42013 type:complete len:251 (-) Transcript_17462:544-1296(-)